MPSMTLYGMKITWTTSLDPVKLPLSHYLLKIHFEIIFGMYIEAVLT